MTFRSAVSTFWCCLLVVAFVGQCSGDWVAEEDLENFINPEDLKLFLNLGNQALNATSDVNQLGNRFSGDSPDADDDDVLDPNNPKVPEEVDCFGLGRFAASVRWMFNLRPMTSEQVNVQFFFSSRKMRSRVQVLLGDQFGLEWVDYNPKRRTIIIIHGFMSHSNASWVHDMSNAFLDWEDVNVIAVDWSRGGNTWKYWRAVANTRRVGADVTQFLRQLMNATGCVTKDFHLVGHSLGAHICSYVAAHLGGVTRITGLDPAQPCFKTTDKSVLLDESDAEFVDVIHTNGRLLSRLGLGLPYPSGHADFYPNGGMKQPGCQNKSDSFLARILPISSLNQAVCSHGRSYLLFTESLRSNNCTFQSHRWNMTYEGVNGSLALPCDRKAACAEMGIGAGGRGGAPRASGPYLSITTDTEPYCLSEIEEHKPNPHLLRDLLSGFNLISKSKSSNLESAARYADPDQPITSGSSTTAAPAWKFWSNWG